jgi:hypothetical protein
MMGLRGLMPSRGPSAPINLRNLDRPNSQKQVLPSQVRSVAPIVSVRAGVVNLKPSVIEKPARAGSAV